MNKITKVVLTTILILTTIAGCSALKAQAEPIKPSVVILDTSIDASLPIFKGRVIQEVCVLEHVLTVCPNNTQFQEGSGSASSLAPQILKSAGFRHGTAMASIAVKTNAYVNVVFVRIVGYYNGYRVNPTATSVIRALDWVIANKDKYNIAAVAMSQSTHDATSLKQLCPNNLITPYADKLKELNIGLFFPAGNDGDLKQVDYPSCIPQAITVGSVDRKNIIATYSNGTPSTVDFYALGHHQDAVFPGGEITTVVGTSAANQVAAMQWATVKMIKPSLTYDELYNLLKSTATIVENGKVKGGSLINIEKATK